jgi:hypothetical protein
MCANDRQARDERQPPIVFALGYAVEALDKIDVLPLAIAGLRNQ